MEADLDYAIICEAFSALPPAARRRIVELAAASGYAAKDLAELMNVSPSAVSRYVHGSLAPSPGAVCRLILGVDPGTREKLVVEGARSLWSLLSQLLSSLAGTSLVGELLEAIADDVASLIEEHTVKAHGRPTTR